jgi:hypothetical protein
MRKLVGLTLLFGCTALGAQDPAHWSNARKEQFLLTATVESAAYAGKGLTNSQKATLTDGRYTHAAHIQHIDIYMPLFKGKDGSTEKDFRDSWKFNVAAYRLAKLLRIDNMVPVSVSRETDGKPGSLDWWVDDFMMDERERLAKNIQPPDPVAWRRQMDIIRIFDQLIYNMDRSQENLLIGNDWHAWMIDHTRAFRQWTTLRNPAAVTHCSPELYQALKSLRRSDIERDLGAFITPREIDGLMARRDLIVAKLDDTNGVEGRSR